MKSLIQELHRIWNQGDLDAIPSVYSEDFVGHWPKGWRIDDSYGQDGVRAAISRIRSAFPDWNEEILQLIEAGDCVVSRYLSTGTHRGKIADLDATGKTVAFEEISIYRIVAGKVTEQWCLADDLWLLEQLQNDE